MMLIGLIWADFAPLSLLFAIVAFTWALRRARFLVGVRGTGWIAVAVVLLPVGGIWLWQRAEFASVCEREGKPVIYRKADADGVFLNSGTANSFGTRYLYDEGFAWIEAPSIYKLGDWVRYQQGSAAENKDAITSTEIRATTARYEVREDFSQPFAHTGLSQTKIIDRTTSEVMAKAGSATYSGGAMKWVLGAWGTRKCPSAMMSSDDFTAFYHLARNTLRGSKLNLKP
ncbi:MAG: hypothetical protein H7232_07330 [Aeromicrobium sp.]|nr:hypothetical protein [Burkholderiales bacterium]